LLKVKVQIALRGGKSPGLYNGCEDAQQFQIGLFCDHRAVSPRK